MVFVMLLFTVTQFGVSNLDRDSYLLSITENLMETDFWNFDIDSLEYEQDYLNNITYFFLDEGYIWETVELLAQFQLIEEESL